MVTSGLIAVNGLELFLRCLSPRDAQNPPLLVIHGGPDWDHSYLVPGLRQVSAQRRVIMFDLRGCGRSTTGLAPEEYQPEYVVADIAALVRAFGTSPIDLLGFSTGGQVAQLLVELASRPGTSSGPGIHDGVLRLCPLSEELARSASASGHETGLAIVGTDPNDSS